MKNTSKKLFSILLTVAMALGLFAATPLTALAGSSLTWTSHPKNQTVEEGSSVKFEANATWRDGEGNRAESLIYLYTPGVPGYVHWEAYRNGQWQDATTLMGITQSYGTLTVVASRRYEALMLRCKVSLSNHEFGSIEALWEDHSTYYYSNNAVLVVNPAKPSFKQHPGSQSITYPGSATFTVDAGFFWNEDFIVGNGGVITYQWYGYGPGMNPKALTDGSIYSGAKTKNLTVKPDMSSEGPNWKYYCVATNAWPSGKSASAKSVEATLSVDFHVPEPDPTLQIITHPKNSHVLKGGNASFSVEAQSSSPISYSWQRDNGSGGWVTLENDQTYSGQGTPTLSLTNVSAGGVKYRCYLRCNHSTGTIAGISNAATLTVYENLDRMHSIFLNTTKIIQQPADASIEAGQSTSFYVDASGDGVQYQWQGAPPAGAPGMITAFVDLADMGIYSGAATDTLRLANVDESYNGYTYRCVVKGIINLVSGVASTGAKLTVTPAASGGGAAITGMTEMTLSPGYAATSAGPYTLSGASPVVAQDSTHGGKITWNGSTRTLDIAPGLGVGEYPGRLTATSGGASGSLTFTLKVAEPESPPSISGTSGMSLAVGYAAASTDAYAITGSPAPTVTKVSGNAAITWDNANKKLNIAPGLAKGTYDVVIKAENSAGEDTLTFTLTVADADELGGTESGGSATGSMSNFTKKRTYTRGMFSDVNETLWYGYDKQKVIANAYEYGLMSGYPDGTFKPGGNITIAEAIAVAARVHRIYTAGADDLVQGSPWYKVYTDYAIANGIITATDFSNYAVAATRAQMAYIFANSLPAAEFANQNTVNSLPDVNSGTPYYSAIITLYEAGVVEGSNGKFNPMSNITRAEASAIIARVILPATRLSGKTYG
jgi:hypothetical protein